MTGKSYCGTNVIPLPRLEHDLRHSIKVLEEANDWLFPSPEHHLEQNCARLCLHRGDPIENRNPTDMGRCRWIGRLSGSHEEEEVW